MSDVIRRSYDLLADRYAEVYRSEGSREVEQIRSIVASVVDDMPENPVIIDLGCGDGTPVADMVAGRSRYIGIDFSAAQIDRARRRNRSADFRCEDITRFSAPPGSVDLVLALYSIIHIPLADQPPLFASIADWLRPGGLFLATLGHTAWTGSEENWLGVDGATMHWSHADAATYRGWIEGVGLEVVEEMFVPEGAGGHTLFRARKKLAP